ncbi:MAG: hypothetical protein HN742_29520 [Lentisphaerae bacterium]|jgi:chondroitin AC lyase|nr:hypothetical protein [Lentisphaerota bacterium]MBT4814695.1 hypothetical protein [Lentisphaerota bacterium]MBT5609037.1 hypothetical protein [Lentisphaerota bacterium]MBT7055469.1 hypothetical protein [Lentisphaerota bacterium]MBT7846048.1 hypothetical protein [Lentisphaerota bacterium]
MTTPDNELARIRERMLAPLLASPPTDRAQRWLSATEADGGWGDVNYAGQSTTSWEPAEHLRRLHDLTQAWWAPKSKLHGDAKLLAATSQALDCWLTKDPRRPWWWDCIGAPRSVSMILLMLDEQLSPHQRRKGVDILKRAKLGATGQNLVWQAEVTARRAVLQRDPGLLRRAFSLIASEIKVSGDEGIQADMSFHQHGACLYSHGYGAGFAVDNARLAALTAGTASSYPAEKIEILARYILDGSQWLAHGPQSDFAAEGREITRPRQTAAYLAKAATYMLELPTGREAEFQELVRRIQGTSTRSLEGNRHFWASDTMVHHRPGWYMSARFYSARTLNTDGLSGCDEGQLSHYLAEGTTCIMRHGNEYRDLFPVWDWQRIPGTTVALLPHTPGEPRRKGENAFAGGASDGRVGVAAVQLKRGRLRARKAWFFFDDVVACIGTDIRCDADVSVVTTLNQCRLNGEVTIGPDRKVLPAEGTHTRRTRWVHHDGIAYVFPESTTVQISNRSATGSWQRISKQRPATPVTQNVFTLGIEHGQMPAGAAYEYLVFPGASPDRVAALAASPVVRVLASSATVQAALHQATATLGAVFHEAGEFGAQGWHVGVDRACTLIVRENRVALSDPTAGTGTVVLEVGRPGAPTRQLTVALPSGLRAGASVVAGLD